MMMLLAAIGMVKAQDETPQLEYVMELKVNCEGAYQVGQTSHGNRFVIPIVGGTFEGPELRGTILPGGADYQLQDQAHGRTEIEAIYSIKTDDGVCIHKSLVTFIVTYHAKSRLSTVHYIQVTMQRALTWYNANKIV